MGRAINTSMLWNKTTYNIRIDKRIRLEADKSVIRGKLPLTEVIAEPAYVDAILRDVNETEKAIRNGTATIYL
jgi:hypothetical protein